MRTSIHSSAIRTSALALVIATGAAGRLRAQTMAGMDHSSHATGATSAANPAGQDAYAAIAAIVATLEADSTTDWSKVNIEALRQHLIVMNEVTLQARSTQSSVPGGARMDITGDGHVAESIRAMWRAHATTLAGVGLYRASVDDIPGGARVTVTAADPRDQKTVTKIRALGSSGLLTLGNHHAAHHLALARGEAMMHR
jgi:hypothetical protein